MSEHFGALLALLSMFAACALVWTVVFRRRTARGKNRVAALLIGALAGVGAAIGVLLSCFLLAPRGDEEILAVGTVGVVILLIYLCVLYPRGRPQEEMPKQYNLSDEMARVARRKALGMSFGDFFSARIEEHVQLWLGVFFLVAWAYLFVYGPSAEDWFAQLLASFIVAGLFVVLCLLSCLLIVPAIAILLILLPFSCVSIGIEAWWRIRNNKPYVAPPVVVRQENIAPSVSYRTDYVAPPAPCRSSGNWLVPLALGFFLGSWWGDDD
ncbi:MAG: hypothetical protein LBM17_07075 [Candidatus Accumulibacter sp.]|jgi:hypothetical protein|nr:hypothetical protein [Accumulibacter sp.]